MRGGLRLRMETQAEEGKRQKLMDTCARWIEKRTGCEVYVHRHDQPFNGFAEYRNGGHILHILADVDQIDFSLFLDILTHEAGHVLYNQRQMAKGISYDEIVERTVVKLKCFDQLLQQKLITDEECDRLYQAMEEEWESNAEKEKILAELKRGVEGVTV